MKLTAAVFTAVIALAVNAPAQAQTALKWGHAYETSEPFHTEAVWAAEEIGKRTQGRYKVTVFPASQLGKENDLNQGLTLGAVDLITSGSSYRGAQLSADRRHLLPLHLPQSRTPDRLYQERRVQGLGGRL